MLKIDRQFGLYVILETLAKGETRACCRAEDPFFDRNVVLRLISPEEVGGWRNLSRLQEYLESLSGLQSPAIAPIHDTGTEEGYCYYSTSFYADGCLTEYWKKPQERDKSLQVFLQIIRGLDYAHSEGFDYGKLSLQDIFFTAGGQVVISDFGVANFIKELKQKTKHQSTAKDDLETKTLHSLGEILIKLLLGTEVKADALSLALLEQLNDKRLANLASDLLGESEKQIHSLAELLERMAELAVPTPEVEETRETEQASIKQWDATAAEFPPATTPSQRQREIKEEIYAKDEVRRLVAEKSKLQGILRRAITYKKQTEKKLVAGAQALAAAKAAEAGTREEIDRTWELVANQQQSRWRPAIWLASGVLVGSLMTGGIYHFQQQAPKQQLLQIRHNQPAPALAPASVAVNAARSVLKSQRKDATKPTVTAEPTLEKAGLWWPVGQEFDPSSAVVAAKIEKPGQPSSLTIQQEVSDNTQTSQAHSVPLATSQPRTFPETQLAKAIQEKTHLWWPAGHEFDPLAATPIASSVVTTEGFDHQPLESPREEVLSVVQNWAKAWASQNLDNYFSYYSTSYHPEQRYTRDEWRAMRHSRLTRPHWIKVRLKDFQLRSLSKNRVQVKLKQSYSSNYYRDQILKSLNLVKENGVWRITMERSLGPVSDAFGADRKTLKDLALSSTSRG